MPVDVKITLSDSQVQTLNSGFDLGGKKAEQLRADQQTFCTLVVTLITDWISGNTRYRSLTEFNIETVQKLYEALLPDEAPSAQRLFNKFNFPPGQAAYVARVLSEKEQAKWRQVSLGELREAIKTAVESSKGVSKSQAGDEDVQLEISLGASRELQLVCNDIKRADKSAFEMPTYVGSLGDFKRWKLTVATLRRINTYFGNS